MNFKTKPKGMWANFAVDCPYCGREMTITNGRVDEHHCHFEISLEDIKF